MRSLVLWLVPWLVPFQATGPNPLLPAYPFKTAHITYKKTPMIEAEAWVAGGQAWMVNGEGFAFLVKHKRYLRRRHPQNLRNLDARQGVG